MHLRAGVLFHRIVQQIHTHMQKAPEPASGPAKDLKAWLDNHIYVKTTVEELSRQIFRSPSQAIRIFRSAYGVTPYEYLLGKRIETAKLLLKNTSLPVTEIADRLQFADRHYFSNFFKGRVGVSPAAFRKTV